jgi:SAM-dependent methyltransferase
MFSAGDAYERFMGRWSRDLAPLLVEFAGVRNGDAVLDVGSGTGALTAAIAVAAPSSRIIGIDPAAPYVAFAEKRHPGDHVRFEVGDAQQLRFADGSFDQTLSLLVLTFIPDRAKALDEMIRVTRPGGTLAAAVWDYGHDMQMLRVFWDEAISLNPAMDARDEEIQPRCAVVEAIGDRLLRPDVQMRQQLRRQLIVDAINRHDLHPVLQPHCARRRRIQHYLLE